MKNKIKEVVKNTLSEALADQFETLGGAILEVNVNATKAKKLGTLGVIVGGCALVHSVMVARQNVELAKKVNDMESEFGETVDEMHDQIQDQIYDLVETVREYDTQMKNMKHHPGSFAAGASTDSKIEEEKVEE